MGWEKYSEIPWGKTSFSALQEVINFDLTHCCGSSFFAQTAVSMFFLILSPMELWNGTISIYIYISLLSFFFKNIFWGRGKVGKADYDCD